MEVDVRSWSFKKRIIKEQLPTGDDDKVGWLQWGSGGGLMPVRPDDVVSYKLSMTTKYRQYVKIG